MRTCPRILFCVGLAVVAACSEVAAPTPPGVFASVSGGFEHTCGILGDGDVYCWGVNNAFQLGYGVGRDRDSLPMRVDVASQFVQVATSVWHSCGVTTAGSTYCWGVGQDGELGSQNEQAPTPLPVDSDLRFARITLGRSHSCGVTASGAAFCWGLNDHGALGRDTTGSVRTPVGVAGNHVFRELAAGSYHTCGLTTAGIAMCWGNNSSGQLGTGDSAGAGYRTPQPVAGALTFVSIAAGNAHTCALTTAGAAYCWGWNAYGMSGDASREDRTSPTAVHGNLRFAAISLGANHSCALTENGELYCWGNNNDFGATPTATCPIGGSIPPVPCSLSPVRVAADLRFQSINAGWFHTCGILIGGGAVCWGNNSQGQVGNGAAGTTVATPARVPDP